MLSSYEKNTNDWLVLQSRMLKITITGAASEIMASVSNYVAIYYTDWHADDVVIGVALLLVIKR